MNQWWQQFKNVYHLAQAQWWRGVYRWPDRSVQMYGITGTNGKTTTAIVLASILREAHGVSKVGLFSTEVFWFGKDEEPNETHMTSTDAKLVFRDLRRMVDQGVSHVVLEMTSHALDQHRLAGIRLDGAIILNITHEHLDYHGTMARYAQAKALIADYLLPGAPLVALRDGQWVERVISKVLTFRLQSQTRWFTDTQARAVLTPLPGAFNKENVLAASMLAAACGVDDLAIQRGVAGVTAVPGRVEWVEMANGAKVLIDFALTPDALERLYTYVKKTVTGTIIAVFGAAGRRDRAKRPLITKIVAKFADEIVLTQDEPYDEPEEQIYRELEQGLVGTTIPWQRIEDRREALYYALAKAQAGDAVVITGMGNYRTRAIGDTQIPWNDRAVVEDFLEELRTSSSAQ